MYDVSDEGLPYHGATLKVPDYIVDKFWYTEYINNDQTPYEPLFRKIPDIATRRRFSFSLFLFHSNSISYYPLSLFFYPS